MKKYAVLLMIIAVFMSSAFVNICYGDEGKLPDFTMKTVSKGYYGKNIMVTIKDSSVTKEQCAEILDEYQDSVKPYGLILIRFWISSQSWFYIASQNMQKNVRTFYDEFFQDKQTVIKRGY